MFAAFKMNLPFFSAPHLDDFCSIEKESLNLQNQFIQESLDKYMLKDGALKASELEKDWFPQIKADVFLSHAHKDEKQVIAFAGYLKSLGISSFIDSCVWGYANDLLKQIDDDYCVQSYKPTGGRIYDYDKRNYSTAQVHMLLNGALLKMMDRTECLIFIDTPNSMKVEDISDGVTNSGWIYSELLMSRYIERKFPLRGVTESAQFSLKKSLKHRDLSIDYDVNISHLINLSLTDIVKAAGLSNNGTKLLDELYLMKKIYES